MRNLNQRRPLNVQAFALALGTGTAQLFVAALYIVTARSMRPDEFGPIVTAIALGIAGAGFVDLGTNLYLVREIASGRITQCEQNAKLSTRFLAVSAVAAVVVVAASFVEPTFVATGVLLVTTSTVQAVLIPLRAAQRAELVGALIVLGRTVAFAAFWGQTAIAVSPGIALWTSLAVGDFVLTVCAFGVPPAANRLRLSVRTLSNPWSGTKWYAVFNMSTSAQQLDLPIVAALSGPAAAGIYGGVNRWIQPMTLAIKAFCSAAAPMIAAEQRVAALRTQFLRASWLLAIAMVISVLTFALAPWLVTILLGDDFRASATVLRILAVAVLLNIVTQPLIIALQSRRRDHVAAAIMSATVVTQLIAVVTLAPTLGALAAGIGMLVGQVVALFGTVACIATIAYRQNRPSE